MSCVEKRHTGAAERSGVSLRVVVESHVRFEREAICIRAIGDSTFTASDYTLLQPKFIALTSILWLLHFMFPKQTRCMQQEERM